MAKTLGSLSVGSIVKIKVNGTPTEFIVVQQGVPDGYDSSCDGTWLLMKDIIEIGSYGDPQDKEYMIKFVAFKDSVIYNYLNNTLYNLIDPKVRELIKTVRIPCTIQHSRIHHDDVYAYDDVSCKVFVLSSCEVGLDVNINTAMPSEGKRLSYFLHGTSRVENEKRLAKFQDRFCEWWTRSPCRGDGYIWTIVTDGYYIAAHYSGYEYYRPTGYRPTFILPKNSLIDSNNNVATNQRPNSPSSINLPSTIKGGESCKISWAASTDPDGNLEGYIVERSYNGGSSWSQIYQGSGTSTSTTIPHGTNTVMFRVQAYDTEGEKSGWRTSSNKTVVNNRAPNAPPAINVPVTPSGGESITVTWSTSSDPDGNLEGYELERQWDGKGSFDQIYRGAALSHTDSIPKGEHTSVVYRVRAYDSSGDKSGYTTSPSRTISNNTAPVIQCDLSGDLGDKTDGFSIPYTVTDAEQQEVTVTEKVGDLVKRTYQPTLGESNTFEITGEYFQKILNGANTITMTAQDAGGKSSTLSLTFVKKVHKSVISLSEPIASGSEISVCVVGVTGNIPEDSAYKVEVSNNAKDDTPTWEDATQDVKLGRNHVFTNKNQTNGWAFNFRVTAERGQGGESEHGGNIISIQGGFQ